jgi:hypothetical protein
MRHASNGDEQSQAVQSPANHEKPRDSQYPPG